MQHIFQAIILGLIQGVTEFIPISSSGHLVITEHFLHWNQLGGKTFDLALHLGTLFSLFIYFWKDIIKYTKAFFDSIAQRKIGDNIDRKLVWLLLLSAVPGFIFGGLFDEYLEAKMGTPLIVAFNLIFFALIMFFVDHYAEKKRNIEQSNWLDALFMGIAQSVALIPGVSRSGITMTAGLARKLTREAAARFSFLMLVPIISGAVLYKLVKIIMHNNIHEIITPVYLAGILTAFISGYICIAFLLKYLRTKNFDVFVLYRILLGAFIIFWYFIS